MFRRFCRGNIKGEYSSLIRFTIAAMFHVRHFRGDQTTLADREIASGEIHSRTKEQPPAAPTTAGGFRYYAN